MYNKNVVSLQPVDDQSHSLSVYLDTVLKTRFLCCVPSNALLLTYFFVSCFRIFLETYQLQCLVFGDVFIKVYKS